jgi:hypothetical protein
VSGPSERAAVVAMLRARASKQRRWQAEAERHGDDDERTMCEHAACELEAAADAVERGDFATGGAS